MRYQEAIINGFWSYRLYDNQSWIKFDAVMLKSKIQEFKDKAEEAQRQLDGITIERNESLS